MSYLILTILLAASGSQPRDQQQLPSHLDLEKVRRIVVQHDGRWPPLDTLARDTVESITGRSFYQGHDPVLLLLAWTFDPSAWMQRDLIEIKNAELRGHLQLPAQRTSFSFAELQRHRPLQALIAHVRHLPRGQKPDPLQKKVQDIDGKLLLLEQVFTGRLIRPVPDPNDPLGRWQAIELADDETAAAHPAVAAAWKAMASAFRSDDAGAFADACDRLVAALQALPAAHRPDPKLIQTELRYNRLEPFRLAWMVMLVGAALAAVAMVVGRKGFDAVAVAGLVAGFAVLTYGLVLRWQIAGRIPAANMFESLLFLSWGMGAFAILSMIFLRDRIVPLTASAMGALALILADVLPLDHYIRPVAPVLLDTIWMSIHVPVIMTSYSVLALAVLIAHVQLITIAAAPTRKAMIEKVDSLHYWYVYVGALLLLAGVVTGSMWAASSWGRYWGWDPKEVWSLIALLGYLTILHVRIAPCTVPWWVFVLAGLAGAALLATTIPLLGPVGAVTLGAVAGTLVVLIIFVTVNSPFATALKSILAFWLIVMTYVGVNYVLGSGLHSYGFGSGAVVRHLSRIAGAELVFVALCCLAYLVRLRGGRKAAYGPEPGE